MGAVKEKRLMKTFEGVLSLRRTHWKHKTTRPIIGSPRRERPPHHLGLPWGEESPHYLAWLPARSEFATELDPPFLQTSGSTNLPAEGAGYPTSSAPSVAGAAR